MAAILPESDNDGVAVPMFPFSLRWIDLGYASHSYREIDRATLQSRLHSMLIGARTVEMGVVGTDPRSLDGSHRI